MNEILLGAAHPFAFYKEYNRSPKKRQKRADAALLVRTSETLVRTTQTLVWTSFGPAQLQLCFCFLLPSPDHTRLDPDQRCWNSRKRVGNSEFDFTPNKISMARRIVWLRGLWEVMARLLGKPDLHASCTTISELFVLRGSRTCYPVILLLYYLFFFFLKIKWHNKFCLVRRYMVTLLPCLHGYYSNNMTTCISSHNLAPRKSLAHYVPMTWLSHPYLSTGKQIQSTTY